MYISTVHYSTTVQRKRNVKTTEKQNDLGLLELIENLFLFWLC